MKTIIYAAVLCSSMFLTTKEEPMSDIYGFTIAGLTGEAVNLADYKGKSMLIVNTASECGYTPQYADLQKLHEQMGDKVVIIGFPANNFGGQEPGTLEQIADFCEKNYGVTFTMTEKVSVKGADRHPIYTWLVEQSGKEPNWNFCKYLVSPDGSKVEFFPSGVNPFDEQILSKL